jgi:hypothetical protein
VTARATETRLLVHNRLTGSNLRSACNVGISASSVFPHTVGAKFPKTPILRRSAAPHTSLKTNSLLDAYVAATGNLIPISNS